MARSQERHYACDRGVWLFANRYGDANGGPDYWSVRERTSVVALGRITRLKKRHWLVQPDDGGPSFIRAALWMGLEGLCPRRSA